MSVFEKVIRQNFFVMGEDAVYTPADTGVAQTVKVMPRQPDEVFNFQDTPILTETNMFEIQVSELPAPKQGDRLAYKGKTYIVQSDPQNRDPDRLIWRLNTRPDE